MTRVERCGRARLSGGRRLGPARHRLADAVLPRPARDHPDRQPRRQRDALRTGSASTSRASTTTRRARPGLPADLVQLVRYAAVDDDPVPADRLSDRLLDLALRRAAQDLLLVLVMLPFWTSYLIRTYAWMIDPARQRGRELAAPGGRPDRRADHPDEHRLLGDPRHDLRLPAVRDPAAVRLDRPARPDSLVAAAATCTRAARSAFLHVTLPLTMPGHRGGGAPHVHPGHRRLRHAGPARRRPDDDHRQDHPGRCSSRAATGRTAPRSASS